VEICCLFKFNFQSKVALLEATNKMLEGKLEIQELKGQIRVLKEQKEAVQEELAKAESNLINAETEKYAVKIRREYKNISYKFGIFS
jgi:uncharacterized protein (DUF3084 family)